MDLDISVSSDTLQFNAIWIVVSSHGGAVGPTWYRAFIAVVPCVRILHCVPIERHDGSEATYYRY